MKNQIMLVLLFAVILVAAYSSVTAQDEMPPMGAPDEIKALSWLVGEWDVIADFRMDEKSEWMNSTATAVYYFSVDSCVMEMDYTSQIMGMNFVGNLIETYDRILKQYQTVWTDNMNARISYYTGYRSGDSTVLSGDEYLPDGSKFLSKITTYNETKTSFEWKSETSSDGGKTFWVSGKAKYTKKNK